MRNPTPTCLALVALLPACVTEVRLVPRDPGWTVAGDTASWRAGDVEVVASLVAVQGDRFPVRGEIRCASPATVAFVPGISSAGELGELRARGAAPSPIAPNASSVPSSDAGGAPAFAFSLFPDVAWSHVPVAGATVSYTIVARSAGREERIPFLFVADVDGPRLTTLGWAGIGVGTAALLAVIFVGASGYFVATAF